MKQSSTFSEEPAYSYDSVGRLTRVQEIPAGESCTTREYSYDGEGDRTSLTTYAPNSKHECATEEGTTEHHSYDEANKLMDEGVVYEALGNTITLPASDAGESPLESDYYVDGQVSTQTQSGKTVEYELDPDERTRETVSGGKTIIDHYDGQGSSVAWADEGSGKWTRNVPGIDGSLAAVQSSGGNIELQIHDLQGNVVATTGPSETETKILNHYTSTEFGVPRNKEAPPKYAWLGADGVASEFPTGTITQDGVTYVPQTGRALQTSGVPLPFPDETATTFTRPIEAWVGSRAGEGAARELGKAEEVQRALEGANRPPGAIPGGNPGWWCGEEYGPCEEEIESGGGGCTGDNACAARVHHCDLKVQIEEINGDVLAVATASCGGSLMPQYSEVEGCLYMRNAYAPIEDTQCHYAGSGFNPYERKETGVALSKNLYAFNSIRCESEVGYVTSGWFWMPGMKKGNMKFSKIWECGESTSSEILGFIWSWVEVVTDKT